MTRASTKRTAATASASDAAVDPAAAATTAAVAAPITKKTRVSKASASAAGGEDEQEAPTARRSSRAKTTTTNTATTTTTVTTTVTVASDTASAMEVDTPDDASVKGKGKKAKAPAKKAEKDDADDDAAETDAATEKTVVANVKFSAEALKTLTYTTSRAAPNGKPINFKIACWNVNGLKNAIKEGCLQYLEYEKPDVLCIQETKCGEGEIPADSAVPGYYGYWYSAQKRGYAGTGMYSKTQPIRVSFGLNVPEHDTEGRVITAEFADFYLVTAYVPNSGQKLETLPYRQTWDVAFRTYLLSLDAKKPVVLCGDLNVAHNEIDLKNPKTNKRSAGFTPQEREGFTTILGTEFVDSFRVLYPEESAYSFWSYRHNSRALNVGWRLDYFVVSQRFMQSVADSQIRSQVYGSDHCPIVLHLSL
ncbi:APEX nuclease [Capsaspora owczarzaki ATCC 30864]|uniref:DNA-(apurinic or apyrimidinic site) endonuclease n=1 Tax=Capsaspora owczarzaki (strain ATCC 30864) TaxID=595528 RepID=A0A0D2U1L2_CAPO3|nr:APEX nuclease [Capsaspora owczarzaki ATCC 30864]KJE89076.1 APEX nuclease [Capsaspora owczarzaki ATCC 30864]|eukprot:XP_004365499.2 APEX nuclease [Capsaspora owczarzaki ATCC 30864]